MALTGHVLMREGEGWPMVRWKETTDRWLSLDGGGWTIL